MKFSKLIEKAEKFAEHYQQGRKIESGKLTKLQRLLNDKVARYEARLEADMNAQKRQKLETRLKVVKAQLQKSIDLTANS